VARDPIPEFRDRLRELRKQVGGPTYPELKACADRLGEKLSTSTIDELLKGPRLQRWKTVRAFVLACDKFDTQRNGSRAESEFDLGAWQVAYDEARGRAGGREYAQSQAGSGYLGQVRELAPAAGLVGREPELRDLEAFCCGDEAYVWWQAEPWAGKSALMSTFVLDPPAQVDVVSFFVTARLAAQSDSNAFVEALLRQLARILGTSLPPGLGPSEQARLWHEWLGAAAERARRSDRRLALVVDGLDEDRGAIPGSGLASIASLLPKAPDKGLRIILSGRPDPPIPLDVSSDHPLHTCRVRRLSASPYALEIARLAQLELSELLHRGDDAHRPLHRTLLGLITASAGGLSLADLEELAKFPRFDLKQLLAGTFGRTVAGRPDPTTMAAQPVYMFTHETLRVEAITELGNKELDRYRDKIHAWADRYRRDGWPDNTPEYLLRRYPGMLQDQNDSARLASLTSDMRRHDWMLDQTATDDAALTEINNAQRLLLRRPTPEFAPLSVLAAHTWRLKKRNSAVPPALPAAWAGLGDLDLAEQLANSIDDYRSRPRAMAILAVEVASVDPSRAEQMAHQITNTNFGDRARALSEIAATIAGDDPDHAHRLADAAERSLLYDEHLFGPPTARVAGTIASFDIERAEQLARSLDDRWSRSQAQASIAAAIATLDEPRAERIAREVREPYFRSSALAAVALAVVNRDPVYALELVRHIRRPELRAPVLAASAKALVTTEPRRAAQLAERAEHAAQRIRYPRERAEILAKVALTLESADSVRAARLIAEAETAAREIDCLGLEPGSLTDLMRTLALYDPSVAERVAKGLSRLSTQAEALADAAHGLARTEPLQAKRLAIEAGRAARKATHERHPGNGKALADLAVAIARVDANQAELAVRRISQVRDKVPALSRLTRTVTDPNLADRLAAEAYQLASGVPESEYSAPAVMEHAVEALANAAMALYAGNPARAEHRLATAADVARHIPKREFRTRALARVCAAMGHIIPARAIDLIDELADAVGQRGESDYIGASAEEALALARARAAANLAQFDVNQATYLIAEARSAVYRIANPEWRSPALTRIAEALADTHPQESEVLAVEAEGAVPHLTVYGARALADLAAVVGKRDTEHAAELLDEAERVASRMSNPVDHAEAIAWIAYGLTDSSSSLMNLTGVARSKASRLVAEALIGRGFPGALAAVGMLEPTSARASYEPVLRVLDNPENLD